MKKYLMTGVAALAICAAFTSCSKSEELYDPEAVKGISTEQEIANVYEQYNRAFIATFGQPAANQDWGFGRAGTRFGNTGETYKATHEYKDANGTVIAGANMNRNQWASSDLQSHPFGGWIVPDPLTDGQKLRVQMYFQANPNLDHHDPQLRHFYVQQVYTGGSDNSVTTGNQESNVAADGTTVKTGASLNQLTVGVANSHINDFNNGTCTTVNVPQNDGTSKPDQITLMVNVDDTSCFGYHETAGSNVNPTIQHNDKWALVSAKDIDDWAASNGNPGKAVQDKWNRSFLGFDYEMLPEDNVIVPNTYAMLSQVQNINNCQYAVYDGTVMKIGPQPAGSSKADSDITDNLIATSGDAKIEKVNNILVWNGKYISVNVDADATGYTKLVIEYDEATPNSYNLSIGVEGGYINGYNQNRSSNETKVECDLVNVSKITNLTFMNGNADFKIKSVYLTTGANETYYSSEYLLAGTEQIPFYSANTDMYGGEKITLTSDDFYTTVGDKTCLNLDRIKQLYDQGYRPIDTALWNWVKYEPVSDGYYSDWIVTLTKAERQEGKTYVDRIICEDLNAKAANSDPAKDGLEESDWDFNDVVFDVRYDDANTAWIKIRVIGGVLPLYVGDDAHEVHELCGQKPGEDGNYTIVGATNAIDEFKVTINGVQASHGKLIPIKVKRQLADGETALFDMTAEIGKPAAKIRVDPETFTPCAERQDIRTVYDEFANWVKNPIVVWY